MLLNGSAQVATMYTPKLAPPPVTSSGGHFVNPVQPLTSKGAAKELLWFTNNQLEVTNATHALDPICITTTGASSGGRAVVRNTPASRLPNQGQRMEQPTEIYHTLAPLTLHQTGSSSAGESCDERGSISSSGSAISPQSTGMSGGIMNYGSTYGGCQTIMPVNCPSSTPGITRMDISSVSASASASSSSSTQLQSAQRNSAADSRANVPGSTSAQHPQIPHHQLQQGQQKCQQQQQQQQILTQQQQLLSQQQQQLLQQQQPQHQQLLPQQQQQLHPQPPQHHQQQLLQQQQQQIHSQQQQQQQQQQQHQNQNQHLQQQQIQQQLNPPQQPPPPQQQQIQQPMQQKLLQHQQQNISHSIGIPPGIQSNTIVRKRKNHGVAGKPLDEEICLICGDRASGYHYNALSCEGCKGFFRRSITRGASYVCKYGGQCEMDMWMRRRCQACRLKRCREAGMKEECLLSDDQCKARDARRKARQKVSPRTSDSQNSMKSEQISPTTSSIGTSGNNRTPPLTLDPLEALTSDQKQLLEKIVLYQDEFELPNEDDVKRVSEVKISDSGRPKDVSEAIYKHMAEMTVLVTQLVVEFAKCLPGFSDLDREDQITLLKGSACEVMMIRTARRYDIETDTVIFANGIPFSKEDMAAYGGMQGYVDGMFKFCNGMAKLGVDNAEYALITSICIFSDRPQLTNAKKVESLQEIYVACLREYENHRRPKGSNSFAKLLMKLTELRTISVKHSDVLFALKVEKGSLPPLLNEYFDVDNRDLR